MFIGVEADRLALHHHLDRDDLRREPPLGDGPCGAFLAFQREGVLRLAADLMLGGNVLGGDAHVAGAERTGQGADHHVDRLGVAHLLAPAHRRHHIGAAAHVLGAAGQAEFGIPQHQRLDDRDRRLHPRPAQPVDVHRRGFLRHAGFHRGHPAQVHVPGFGVDDVAHRDMADLLGCDAGAGDGGLRGSGPQSGGGHFGQAAAEGTDGSACGVQNHDFGHRALLLGQASSAMRRRSRR